MVETDPVSETLCACSISDNGGLLFLSMFFHFNYLVLKIVNMIPFL